MSASPAGRSPTGDGRGRPVYFGDPPVCHHGKVRFSVHVDVTLRPGIADPQGSTIERALPALGFDGVSGVTVGKSIRFEIDAPDRAAAESEIDELCKRFLTNPVIEDAVVQLIELESS
ncbi:MAG: phosphoribosylformylglycinamidine synthase subunit PurS [Actinomycetia bacterium]|nr:phosphoribosylformylglycinamidine synthase subunit PurS [Actinomycetes bacterium]